MMKFMTAMVTAGLALSPLAAATATKPPAAAVAKKPAAARPPKLDPEALLAIGAMGRYLRTLKSFEIVADGFAEDVLDSGQKVTIPGTLRYAAQLPDKLFAEIGNDRSLRRLYFDGRKVTIDAPRHKLYTDAPLSGSISALIAVADEKYDITLPLSDLFLWGDPARPVPPPQAGFKVGPETIGDTKVDHFAFRQPGIDWQIWITQGDKPLPLRIVMINTRDPAQPQYAAKLTWTINPVLAADRFTFTPAADSGRISLATIDGSKPQETN
jgi:hypothetical protein